MDCSLPGSFIHGIFEARVLEWVAISFSRRSSRHRDWTRVFRSAGRRLIVWVTREVHKNCSVNIGSFPWWILHPSPDSWHQLMRGHAVSLPRSKLRTNFHCWGLVANLLSQLLRDEEGRKQGGGWSSGSLKFPGFWFPGSDCSSLVQLSLSRLLSPEEITNHWLSDDKACPRH